MKGAQSSQMGGGGAMGGSMVEWVGHGSQRSPPIVTPLALASRWNRHQQDVRSFTRAARTKYGLQFSDILFVIL